MHDAYYQAKTITSIIQPPVDDLVIWHASTSNTRGDKLIIDIYIVSFGGGIVRYKG